ncbi:hypothetical protein [uncultured Thiodictyon sp.]|jgi:hypothetical protein|uniref:hypothetical protein n=1 Tax=uncultured Thiodictyon sp. TaxID=1846217 RepID=UPI0025F35F75|nr:hypothetical protein [uncultured Thiodictyon sp.]
MRKTYLLAVLLIATAAAAVRAADQSAPPPLTAPIPAPAPAPAAAQAPAKAPAPAPAKPGAPKKKGSEKAEYKGPTETDIRVAYTDRISEINVGTAQYLDPAAAAKLTIKLVKVDVVECNPVEERKDIYVCSILVEAGVGAGEVEFKRSEVALVKAKDAWRVH